MEVDTALEHVIERIGRARFEAACADAWGDRAGSGRPGSSGAITIDDAADHLTDVPHEISDVLFREGADPLADTDADDVTRHLVVLTAYRRMPCYALLTHFPTVRSPAILDAYGIELCSWLDDPDPRIADPAAYHLAVDEFDWDERVDWAWRVVTEDIESSPRRLQRVLDASGPVPWRLKRSLHEHFGVDPR